MTARLWEKLIDNVSWIPVMILILAITIFVSMCNVSGSIKKLTAAVETIQEVKNNE